VHAIEAAGELRRTAPLVSTITVVVVADDPAGAAQAIVSVFDVSLSTAAGDQPLTGLYQHATITVHVATRDDAGGALFRATGSPAHTRAVAARGLADRRWLSETELYASVGLAFIPPELRHASGEIEAAVSGGLPDLIDSSDMRGDLHMHSLYSDGRDQVSAMVEACCALGYEYMAITDHSFGAAASRTLAIDAIPRQREEIDALRERFPDIAILHGIEVDILPDGRLDFDDAVLEPFDIVLASLHEHARQDSDRLTERSIQAIRHPLVNVLCHPANQLVGRFAGYELDFDAIYAAAAETGTALEVDGAPSHLDLDGERARAAVAAGVTLTIDSDCHRVEALGQQMRFGIGTARRGWITRTNVLNTRPLSEVRAFIAAKRAGRTHP
jgi:DNA polymerase (family 10)